MQCVARHGNARFVLVACNADPSDPHAPARILDVDHATLRAELPLDTVLADLGPWETEDLPDEDTVDALLATVTSA